MNTRDTSLVEKALTRKKGRAGDAEPIQPLSGKSTFSGRFQHDEVPPIDIEEQVAFEHRLICANQDPGVIGAYKLMRTRISQLLKLNGWSSIAITAARKGDGKSVTAINLALSLAAQPDQTVVLVDLDLRNPSIATYLGFDDNTNLMQLLDGDIPLEKALVRVNSTGLYVLANNQQVKNSSELLTDQSVSLLVQTLKGLGAIVIFDLPPLLAADDFLAFSVLVDCTLLVVSEGRTTRQDLARARELLANMNLLGIVLNDSREISEEYY